MENSYTLDAFGHIVDVTGDWDDFAQRNHAHDASGNQILGKKLWNFVSGADTVSYLNAIFFFTRRTGKEFAMNCRCDGPNVARLMKMRVIPGANSLLMVKHQLLACGPHKFDPELSAMRHRFATARCSMCAKIEVGGEWIDPFAKISDQDASIDHKVCPECRRKTRVALGIDTVKQDPHARRA